LDLIWVNGKHYETMLSFDVLLMDAEKTKDVENANVILESTLQLL
jgi:hypothetical protein